MYLYHSFPRHDRFRSETNSKSYDTMALQILRSILSIGLLCTPERLRIFPDPNTNYDEKRALIDKGEPEYNQTQSRFCLTLCETAELFENKTIKARAVDHTERAKSHNDIFGDIAIAFDPIVSRRLGIVPTIYFSPTDVYGNRHDVSSKVTPGLNLQMISRLKEIREILVLHANIEAGICIGDLFLPNFSDIDRLGIGAPFERDKINNIRHMRTRKKQSIYDLFDTDREPAYNLISFIEMMLSLFQETDSYFDGQPLAFYTQREWRLIHHKRDGMIWFSLSDHPAYRDPWQKNHTLEVAQLRRLVNQLAKDQKTESYFSGCWLLAAADGYHVRELIDHIVAPSRLQEPISECLQQLGVNCNLLVSENYY